MTEIGKEYALALFELGIESGSLSETADGVKYLKKVFFETPEYTEFLKSPAIPVAERTGNIQQNFGKSLSQNVVAALCVMTERGNMRCFDSFVREFFLLYDESKKQSNATVFSAAELDDGEKSRIKAALDAKLGRDTKVKFKTDPSLLGGVVIEADGKRIDASVRHKLREMKEVMSGEQNSR